MLRSNVVNNMLRSNVVKNILPKYNFECPVAKENCITNGCHISITLDTNVARVFKDSVCINKLHRAILASIPSSTTSNTSSQKNHTKKMVQ